MFILSYIFNEIKTIVKIKNNVIKMNYVKIKSERTSIEKYFINPSLRRITNTEKLTQLHIYRIKSFIESIMSISGIELPKNIEEEVINTAIALLRYKKEVNATVNEIALAAFWVVIKDRGVSNIGLIKLIDIAKSNLRKKISRKNILRVLARIRQRMNNYNPRAEILKQGTFVIKKLIKNDKVQKKLDSLKDEAYREKYFLLIRKEFLNIVFSIPLHEFSGKSRVAAATILIYLSDKLVAQKLGIKPILAAKLLEEITGTCQFTILRNYKKYSSFQKLRDK